MKIIDDIWFTSSQGIVGIILGEDESTGKHKAYVGIGRGISPEHDSKVIAMLGCPLSDSVAARIAAFLNTKNEGDYYGYKYYC